MINSADIPLQTIEEEESSGLFLLLINGDEETFIQRCAGNRGRLDEISNKYPCTYLQLACMYGLPKAVEALLTNGADPNRSYYPNLGPPIMMAAQQGYYNIVEMLARNNKVNCKSTIEGTVLHAVLEGMSKARDRGDSNFVVDKYVNCIKLILTEKRRLCNVLDINAQNKDGFTALHLAVTLQEKSIILLLLENGAYIGSRCSQGYTPISLMNANVFEEYLNNCINTNGTLPINKDYKIIYDYNFLAPPRMYCNKPKIGQGNDTLVLETEPIIEISGVAELRHLLKHPVLASFLHMKWFTVRKYYWINFIFYLTFWLCLTLHTLTLYSSSDRDEVMRQCNLAACWTWYPSIFLCGLVILHEIFKLGCVLPYSYVTDMENLLAIALLTSNLFVLFGKMDVEIAVIALLLTWAEMILLINRHPSLSSNIEMYKKVCTSFVKLLAWWSMLIVAFALSFHLLFKDYENQHCAQNNNCSTTENYNSTGENEHFSKFFKQKGTSLLKVILMMTGELEASAIPFKSYFGVIIFILFVFLVPVVLFNLMSGLAVSDTQAIRCDAKIVGYATLAKQIASIENMVNCLKKLDNFLASRLTRKRSRMINLLHTHVNLFPYKLRNSTVHVFPNQGNKVVYSNSLGRKQNPGGMAPIGFHLTIPGYETCTGWWIVSDIMNETKKILQERKNKREENEQSSSSNSLDRYSEELKRYSEELHQEYARLALLEETTNEKLNNVIERVTQSEERTNEKLNKVIELLRQRH